MSSDNEVDWSELEHDSSSDDSEADWEDLNVQDDEDEQDFQARVDLRRIQNRRARRVRHSARAGPRFDTFAQKSAAAMGREAEAKRAFDRIRQEVERGGRPSSRELLQPNCHLTGPCYASFSKYVQAHAGWTVRRRTASDAQKRAHGVKSLSKRSFVDVSFQPALAQAAGQGLRARARSPGRASQAVPDPREDTAKLFYVVKVMAIVWAVGLVMKAVVIILPFIVVGSYVVFITKKRARDEEEMKNDGNVIDSEALELARRRRARRHSEQREEAVANFFATTRRLWQFFFATTRRLWQLL